jgi:hypothetical protein
MSDTSASIIAAPNPAFWEFAVKNFALVSTIAVLISVSAALLFLSGYVSVFDWRLIWIIEYPIF